jgi:hypothetical protein
MKKLIFPLIYKSMIAIPYDGNKVYIYLNGALKKVLKDEREIYRLTLDFKDILEVMLPIYNRYIEIETKNLREYYDIFMKNDNIVIRKAGNNE